ncbi:MAG TPA: hypothetical protein VMY78_09455 [Solirubrobacteraceae bacterium]|nr:hypothetical protein [Solirubrobacteraceae bacterium]
MRLAVLAALVALIVSGCGEEQPSTSAAPGAADREQTRDEIERVWTDVLDALRAADGERLCRHATAKYARELIAAAGGATCAEAARKTASLLGDASPADATPRYSRFSTKGDRATIHVALPTDDGPLRNVVQFRFVDGRWNVDRDSGLSAQ